MMNIVLPRALLAERWVASKPARIPSGDWPMVPSDEGLT